MYQSAFGPKSLLQENASLSEFPLCLSRACLGKTIPFSTNENGA
eukprot:COSAG06_NODE_5177_length_3657_cov_4.933671_5_plen_43_part_01